MLLLKNWIWSYDGLEMMERNGQCNENFGITKIT